MAKQIEREDRPRQDSPFERIKRTGPSGGEYWSGRDFAQVLGYKDYAAFEHVIAKARTACFNSGQRLDDHFAEVVETIEGAPRGRQEFQTTYLSRYACYLIIQNADPAMEAVALGQTYFALQARRQEITRRAGESQAEEESRLLLRREMRVHNIKLAGVARAAGVLEPADYALFQNHGYAGLYGGLDAPAIRRRKGLLGNQHILDHMGSTELAANLFRATQTEEKLRRENVRGKEQANRTHYEVGAKVRQTIRELGGTMPEELPTADSIKQIERRRREALKQLRAHGA